MSPLKFSFLFYATAVAGGILAKDHGNLLAMEFLFLVLLGVLAFAAYTKKYWLFHPLVFYVTAVLFYLLCFILGFLSIHWVDWKDNQYNYAHAVAYQQPYQVNFRLVQEQMTKGEKIQYFVEIEGIDGRQTQGQALLLSADSLGQIGDRFTGIGSFQPFSTAVNPGQFDYRAYMLNKQVYLRFSLRQSLYVDTKQSLYTGLMAVRRMLQEQLNKNEKLSTSSKALVSALLLGNRSQLDEQTTATFQRLGLMHILAISGLHIGLIAVFVSKILSFLKTRQRSFILLLFLWSFACIAGFSPSVFRTVLLFSLVVFAQSVRSKQPTSESIGLALFLSLLFKPYWLFDVGFQLSYVAVLGIVWLMPLFKNNYTSSRIVNYFLSLCYVSFVAQLCVLPLQLYYFHSFSWTFIGSNLVVIPLITLLLLGGFCLLCIGWMAESIAAFLGEILEGVVHCIFVVLRALDGVNLYSLTLYTSKETFWGMIAVGLAMGTLLFKPRLKQIAYFFVLVLITSFSCFHLTHQNQNRVEFIIAAAPKSLPLFLQYVDQQLFVFGQEEQTKGIVEGYKKKYAIHQEISKPRTVTYQVDAEHKLLVLSQEMPFYELQTHFELIYLSENVQVNMDRVLALHQPKMVIIGQAMSQWHRAKVIQSCLKKNIPFHDMREKGYWSSQFL